ncbi:hypothetical protein BA062_24755 [Prauserella flavalba]|uniref:Uncharacterized protein n=1 Tax=Prauserella flavalba TaxID=1477506 RepID=A0A318LN35_9PSEU|nr:hypothetical protein BA062_24755 [Prauserella flavalba]
MFAHEERLDAKRDRTLVRPGFRERIEELLRGQWGEPVIVLRLSDNTLAFDVPGRRLDGTVKGKKLIRRFFWNIVRGIGTAVGYVLYLAHNSAGGKASTERVAQVKGPENAMVLDLVDRLRGAKGPWLACSPSSLAIVDTGSTFTDPADAPPPRILWQARRPQAPEVDLRGRTITWPDGSTFEFPLHGRTEDRHLRTFLGPQGTINWT